MVEVFWRGRLREHFEACEIQHQIGQEHLIRRPMPYLQIVRQNPYLQVKIRGMSRLCA